MKSNRLAILSASSIFAIAAFSNSAVAQTNPDAGAPQAQSSSETSGETDSGGLGDIVVTAQRRSESLQRVPIAVAVATSEQLSSSGVANVDTLKVAAPGVEVEGIAWKVR